MMIRECSTAINVHDAAAQSAIDSLVGATSRAIGALELAVIALDEPPISRYRKALPAPTPHAFRIQERHSTMS